VAPDPRSALAHLYRRAGFGARPEQLDAAVRAGYAATVDRLLDPRAHDPAAAAVEPPSLPLLERPGKGADRAAKTSARQQARRQATELTLWWLQRMVAADNPLPEKLTLFWHGHFATSIRKVHQAGLMERQNRLLRTMGAGPVEALTLAVARDAAMLVWLDGNQNRSQHPNENFARELMELFTVGIGNFTEADVKAVARAFTGWRVDRRSGEVRFAPARFDPGPKTIQGQTGAWGAADAVRVLTHSPAAAGFVAARMWSFFARPVGIDDPVVTELARGYAGHRDAGLLVRAVLTHPDFTSPATRTGLVKTPVEYVAGTLRALRLDPDNQTLGVLRRLGQVPFAPPSVGGWPANAAWLTTASSLERLRFARACAAKADLSAVADEPAGERPAAAAHLLGVDRWGPTSAAALAAAARDPELLVALALVTPEHVLN